MAETSWPSPNHNSRAVTDAEYELLVAPYTGNGLVGKPSDSPTIFADGSGRTIKVRANRYGLVRGQLYSSGSTDDTKTIAANAGAVRFDLVVLRWDRSTLNATVEIIEGSPGSGPPSPTVNTGTTGVYEIALAKVRVATGASVINGVDVTPLAYFLGPQPINCTSTTHPPCAPGLTIFETDTGEQLVSNAAGTVFVPQHNDTGWTTFGAKSGSGWVLLTGKVRKKDGIVYIKLLPERSGSTLKKSTASTIAQLDDAFWPDTDPVHWVAYQGGTFIAYGLIDTSGNIQLLGYSGSDITSGDVLVPQIISYPAR